MDAGSQPLVLINAFEVPESREEEFVRGPGFREVSAGLADFRPHPALYRVVRT